MSLNNIRGFFMDEADSNGGSMKYFVIGSDCRFFSTRNLALLQHLTTSCKTVNALYQCCDQFLKCQTFKYPLKLSEVKTFNQPEKFWCYSTKYFRMSLILSPGISTEADGKPPVPEKTLNIQVFSFDDESLILLHMFANRYSEIFTEPSSVNDFLQTKLLFKSNDDELVALRRFHKDTNLPQYKLKHNILIDKIETDSNEINNSIPVEPKRVLQNDASDPKDEKSVEKIVKLSNGSLYTGQILEGFPHGTGKEFLANGSSYVGQFRMGLWHGHGYLVDRDNHSFDAEFFEGRLIGI
jgi:hypothetical protein